jgi:aminoglycoside 6-adenylyltransferase
MRSDREMLELIVGTAREDERIRAVILNGSRTDPAAPRDPFQDFDIVYIVTDVAAFRHNLDWIRRFGELMILQMPGEMQSAARADGSFAYLMQFSDGNRIDLTIYLLAKLPEINKDSLSVLLLDKDGILEPLPPATASDYLPRPPEAKAFADCCNEFWWVCPYVAKGLRRAEITYAKAMMDGVVRTQLMQMLAWHIGVKDGFTSNPGKLGRHFQRHLEPQTWEMLLKTYSDASEKHTWDALEAMCSLFRITAIQVAKLCRFDYPDGVYGELLI